MPEVRVCKPVARLVRAIADQTTGAPPEAITLGTFVFLFGDPQGEELERLRRHEAVHVEQQARMAPRWARWLPKSARVYLGAPRFYLAYADEYDDVGYERNRFEVEARAAE